MLTKIALSIGFGGVTWFAIYVAAVLVYGHVHDWDPMKIDHATRLANKLAKAAFIVVASVAFLITL